MTKQEKPGIYPHLRGLKHTSVFISDIEWTESRLRNEFDCKREPWEQELSDIIIIGRAHRFLQEGRISEEFYKQLLKDAL